VPVVWEKQASPDPLSITMMLQANTNSVSLWLATQQPRVFNSLHSLARIWDWNRKRTILTQSVVQYFSKKSPCLLILDNLDTAWEPIQARDAVEEFLSLLTEVSHLALIVSF
jgi:hypothetical protein